MSPETSQPLHRRVWQWIRNQIVQEVPESVGLCEFDCRKQECEEGDWANCERRIQDAAGESWTESPTALRGGIKVDAAPSTAPSSPTAARTPQAEKVK